MAKIAGDDNLSRLVELAKDGDRRAYGRIFTLCYKDIYDYVLRRVGNRDDAEDLVMHVFARGLVAISGYEERGFTVKAWLFRIAHNAVVDHFRSQVSKTDIDTMIDLADDSDVEWEVVMSDQFDKLSMKIAGLPRAQNEVLTLRFIEDLSVAETAVVLSKKEVTVRALQFKGIRNLKLMVEREEAEAGKRRLESETDGEVRGTA